MTSGFTTSGGAASWEIDLAGGLRREREAARAGVRVSVVADAVDAYLQIRGAQAQIMNIHKMIALQERELALVKDRAASGAASERDVVSAASELDNVKKLLPVVEIALEVQFNQLDVLKGVQSGFNAQKLAVTAPVPDPPLLSGAIQPEKLLRTRPDVIAAERRLAAANARIGQTLADYYPKLSLSGIVGFESLRANKMFTPAGFQPVGQGAIRWRIFDFGKIDAEATNAPGGDRRGSGCVPKGASSDDRRRRERVNVLRSHTDPCVGNLGRSEKSSSCDGSGTGKLQRRRRKLEQCAFGDES